MDNYKDDWWKMDGTVVTVQAQAAGKLYLAGEYAVVEAGRPAILIAVDRGLSAQVTSPAVDTQDAQTGSMESIGHPEASMTWHREHGKLIPDSMPNNPSYLLAAATTVEELAADYGLSPRAHNISISSQLDAGSGKKYGLGSSAAVTVASVQALLDCYGIQLQPLEIYKLAYLATGRAQSLGSGGDLAASLFGGCIRFCSPDRTWVKAQLESCSLSELIEQPWPGLQINRLDAFGANSALRIMVGWTGSPASTPSLIASVKNNATDGKKQAYERFLEESTNCVNALADAMVSGQMVAINQQIMKARSLLQELSHLTDTAIETPALRTLVETALIRGAAAKSSGAGGGDCGIAIVYDHGANSGSQAQIRSIREAWTQSGIEPLDISVGKVMLPLPAWQHAQASGEGD